MAAPNAIAEARVGISVQIHQLCEWPSHAHRATAADMDHDELIAAAWKAVLTLGFTKEQVEQLLREVQEQHSADCPRCAAGAISVGQSLPGTVPLFRANSPSDRRGSSGAASPTGRSSH